MLLRIIVCVSLVIAVMAGLTAFEAKAKRRRRRSGQAETSLTDRSGESAGSEAR